MRYYIDFTDGLGSDNTIRVDGRLSRQRMVMAAEEHAHRMRRINRSPVRRFKIIAGRSLLSAVPISQEYVIEVKP